MGRKQLILCFIVLKILCFSAVTAREIEQNIDAVVQDFLKLDQFSGSILLGQEGKILYAKAFGEADKDHHVMNTLDTKFNIGSIGKTFTAIAIMQLAEKGKLKVSDPVIKYLPDFPYGDEITIHHLLTHTSGMYNYFAHPEFATQMYRIRSVSGALPLIYDQELRFDTPGERFSYSNSGIVVLGAVIEKLSGQRYPEYLMEHILTPAGMNDTNINYFEQVVENRASGYIKSPSGRYIRNIFRAPPANADGGIESTAYDMLKYDQAIYTNKLISAESWEKMSTDYGNEYGYCFRVYNRYGNKIVGHSGGAPGLNASFYRYLDDQYILIVLSNYSDGAIPVAHAIAAVIFGEEYIPPRPDVEEFLYRHLKDKGEEAVLNNIKTLLSENGYEIDSSRPLNRTGYQLLNENDIDMAIGFFKLNIRLFPEEANGYDSLGDAYIRLGDKEEAIVSFQKALEKDPDFQVTKDKLDQLLQNN